MTWYAKPSGAYARTSAEAIANAREIYSNLSQKGWALNAVCGVLGNMGYEGGYNPWRWQADILIQSTDTYHITTQTSHAYGLVQFDPAGKYINNAKSYTGYSPNYADKSGLATDGLAQILYINDHADYYSTTAFPLSYSQYKVSTNTPSYLAEAWVRNYERPSASEIQRTLAGRQAEAEYWYKVLQDTPPTPPTPTHKKMKLMFYLKRRY